MIRVERTSPPALFAEKRHQETRDRLFAHYGEYTVQKRQSRFDWGQVMRLLREARSALEAVFQGKCAYCESRLGPVTPGIIDHYRPKRGARGLDKQYSDVHYWWLALEWENLLFVCPQCNRFKGSWFPLTEGAVRAEPGITGDALSAEQPLLLDPCTDDPEQHLDFANDGSIRARSQRGQVTIEILRLDRGELRLAREECLAELRTRYETFRIAPGKAFARDLLAILDQTSGGEYLAIQRQFLFAWLEEDPGLLDALESYPQPGSAAEVPPGSLEAAGADYDLDEEEPQGYAIGEDDTLGPADEPVRGAGPSPRGFPAEAVAETIERFDVRRSTSDFVQKKAAYSPADVEQRQLDLKRFPIQKIEIHNFKNIADLTIEVPQFRALERAPWQLFLGKNAVGKSAILQALVLSLMGKENLDRWPSLRPKRFLRYYKRNGDAAGGDEGPKRVYCKKGYVKIWIAGDTDPSKPTIRLSLDEKKFESSHEGPGTYLLAYGATRLLLAESSSAKAAEEGKDFTAGESERMVRVQNLFDPAIPLIDVSKWLYRLYDQEQSKSEEENQYYYVARALRAILLMKEGEGIWPDEKEEDKIWIELNGELGTLDSISDGYRGILAIAADIIHVLLQEGTSMEEAEGIVIIDEIGANLHPGWKKRIVGCFRDVFPRIQFIVTSHNPLCLRGLEDGETVLLRRDLERKIVAVTDLPNPNDMRVDQILASEFFGLSTTLESDLEDVYDEYYQLLLVKEEELTGDQEKRLRELKQELRQREHLGSSLRDELMYEVIDRLVARQLHSPKPKEREPLKLEAVQ